MFCKNCGNNMNDNVKFCAACGTPQIGDTQYSQQETVMVQQANPVVPQRGKKDKPFLLILAAIVILLLAIGQIALSVVGKTTRGQIVRVDRKRVTNYNESTSNPNRYTVHYEFTVNGEKYTGSVRKILKHGLVVSSDGTRPTISVRYLPSWPHINSEDSGEASFSGLFFLGIGILLFIAGTRKKKKPEAR